MGEEQSQTPKKQKEFKTVGRGTIPTHGRGTIPTHGESSSNPKA